MTPFKRFGCKKFHVRSNQSVVDAPLQQTAGKETKAVNCFYSKGHDCLKLLRIYGMLRINEVFPSVLETKTQGQKLIFPLFPLKAYS
jgi:hypothetical protein